MGCSCSKSAKGETPSPLSPQQESNPRATVTLDDSTATQVTFDPEQVVDSGGYCDVFMGTDLTGQNIALKRYRTTTQGHTIDDLRELIRNEARVWRGLKHDNILPFLGIGRDTSGLVYLASPWMDNGTLPVFLSKNPQTVHRPRFILEVADALAHLQSKNVVHGDIKGANILVSLDHHALLCDFGLSRVVRVATQAPLKGAGSTPWQSPELLDSKPKSYASDIYAFGMTIYEVLTGNIPFHGRLPSAIINAVVYKDERPTIPEARSSHGYLWEVAERCWQKDPDRRPPIQLVLQWIQQEKCDPLEDVYGPTSSSGSRESPEASTGRRGRSNSHRAGSSNTARGASQGVVPPLPPLPRDRGSNSTHLSSAPNTIDLDDEGRPPLPRKPGVLRPDSPRPSTEPKQPSGGSATGVMQKPAGGTSTRVPDSQAAQSPRSVSFSIPTVDLGDDVVLASLVHNTDIPVICDFESQDTTPPIDDPSLSSSARLQNAFISPERRTPSPPSPPLQRSDSHKSRHTSKSQKPEPPNIPGGNTGMEVNVGTQAGKGDTPPRLHDDHKRGKHNHLDTSRSDLDSSTPRQKTPPSSQFSNPNPTRGNVTGVDTPREPDYKRVAAVAASGTGRDVTSSYAVANELYSEPQASKKDKVSEQHRGPAGPHSYPTTGDPSGSLTKGVGAGSPPLAEKQASERRPKGPSSADPPPNSQPSSAQPFLPIPPTVPCDSRQEVSSQPSQPASTTSDQAVAGLAIDLTDPVESHHANGGERLRTQDPRSQTLGTGGASSSPPPSAARPSNQAERVSSPRREDVTTNKKVTPSPGSNSNVHSVAYETSNARMLGGGIANVPESNIQPAQGYIGSRLESERVASQTAPTVSHPSNRDTGDDSSRIHAEATRSPAASSSANRQRGTDPPAEEAHPPQSLNHHSPRDHERDSGDASKRQPHGHATGRVKPTESASNIIQSRGSVEEPSASPHAVAENPGLLTLGVADDLIAAQPISSLPDSESGPSSVKPKSSRQSKPGQRRNKGSKWK